ncbi:MAG: exodeoxyribonuclease VII large subunit [Nitrospirae bacterium]|jgi:exodeoxyribonuclease VII large subunit|nr:exodeoxyribonuclease VII large subunit [Nitrospirota bacterium]
MNFIKLSELSALIKSSIFINFPDEYWVIAEIAQINLHTNSGHCYIDLVEKQDDSIITKMRANIWSNTYRIVASNFRKSTGQELQPGMKILILVKVTYHDIHGLSLNIKDIDPGYTLGEMALKRKQVIEQLSKEGLIDLNKKLPLPPVIQNIAVISSADAAGYGDFSSRLANNPYKYRFYHKLFPAYVQGEKADKSILSALNSCLKEKSFFDAVVIIRGGGSTVDLHCFDSYTLAKEIALFPLPVFTGIGHEKDETVADRVAKIRFITPTAVAEFLISKAREFENNIDALKERLVLRTLSIINTEESQINQVSFTLSKYIKEFFKTSNAMLKHIVFSLQASSFSSLQKPALNIKSYEARINSGLIKFISDEKQSLREKLKTINEKTSHFISMQNKIIENIHIQINLLNPLNVLKRGYSITTLNGKVLKSIKSVKKTDAISTQLQDGKIISNVELLLEESKDE